MIKTDLHAHIYMTKSIRHIKRRLYLDSEGYLNALINGVWVRVWNTDGIIVEWLTIDE